MERGGGGRRSPFGFGDPFAGFGGHGNLISGFFAGRNPFEDDPFFARPPFGGMFNQDPFFARPFGSLLGPGMFDHGVHGPAAPRQQSQSRGPIIEEVDGSDGEEERNGGDREQVERPRKDSRSNDEPWVQHPDDEVGDRSKQTQLHRDYSNMNRVNPQAQTFSFQSSTVTYGGANGAYYTSSTTRRMGGDGVVFEENKEADSTSGRASHKISRGIGDKGHSVSRKLNTDGRVDTMQTLHNLNEGELDAFERAWEGNAKKYLPGMEGFNMNHHGVGESSSWQNGQGSRGWALPSTEQPQRQERASPRFNIQGRASVDNLKSVKPQTHGMGESSSWQNGQGSRGWALPSTEQPQRQDRASPRFNIQGRASVDNLKSVRPQTHGKHNSFSTKN